MSAFAALKSSKSLDELFNNVKKIPATTVLNNDGSNEDEDVISYQQDSEESDNEDNYENHVHDDDQYPVQYEEEDEEKDEQEVNSLHMANGQPSESDSPVYCSKFEPNLSNMVFVDDYKMLVGLRENEYIVISGQFKLMVQKGAVLLNSHHYVESTPREYNYPIIAPQSHGLPLISSTPCLTRSNRVCGDLVHGIFDNNDYISVIQLESMQTGLENIGKHYPVFKPLFEAKISNDFNEYDLQLRNKFKDRTFEIIFKDVGVAALKVNSSWSKMMNKILSTEFQTISSSRFGKSTSNSQEPKVIMVIGNKNSGKSTFSKTLLNSFLLRQHIKIAYLDIDPGQSEFSVPGALSLSTFPSSEVTFGLNIPATTTSSSVNDNLNVDHYFGFNSPSQRPLEYASIINGLFKHYLKYHKPLGYSLIINTPGWIKGFGKEMLIDFTKLVHPDHLILLSSSLALDDSENVDTSSQLTYKTLDICLGVEIQSKFTAAQLRSLNKLYYFHQVQNSKFDFLRHLLSVAPVKLSYSCADSPGDEFIGINAITCLNFDVSVDFDHEDLPIMLDASVFGLYLVDRSSFESSSHSLYSSRSQTHLPMYLNSKDYKRFVSYDSQDKVKFMGICIVHSINLSSNYVSMYLPQENALAIKELMHEGAFKLLLVKGDGEVPSFEFLHPELLLEHEKQVKGSYSQKRNAEANENWQVRKLPYISFENKRKIGGVWRVRRGVTRRGHR